jgi:hypothetical protein
MFKTAVKKWCLFCLLLFGNAAYPLRNQGLSKVLEIRSPLILMRVLPLLWAQTAAVNQTWSIYPLGFGRAKHPDAPVGEDG